MRAHVVSRPGPPSVIRMLELDTPRPQSGQVLIEVHAFGLNRSEMFTRQGHSPSVSFPRVLGIECVGIVAEAPGGEFTPGQRVAALMGGMGREFDGGYAEYTCVPAACVVGVDVDLDWRVFAATPEMFQTAWGSLSAGLGLAAGHTLLVRGGSSSVGMLAAQLAQRHGARVIATTRNPAKAEVLKANGADTVVIDDGEIAGAVREQAGDGVDAVLELIGTATLIDSLDCCRPQGTVCMTGILGNAWTLDAFAPMEQIPHTVRLTIYTGGPADLDATAYNRFLGDVRDGRIVPPIDRQFAFEQVIAAHEYMESDQATGKLVVSVRPG